MSALLSASAPSAEAGPRAESRLPAQARVVARVRNPSGSPLLAALQVRRALLPPPLADPHTVTVPRWTARRRFQAGEYGSVGVVPAGGTAELVTPAPAGARRCLVTVVVGQDGSRLRVHRLRVGAAEPAAAGDAEALSPCQLA